MWVMQPPVDRIGDWAEDMSWLSVQVGVVADAERRLRGLVPAPAPQGRRLLRRQPTPDAEVVAGRVGQSWLASLAKSSTALGCYMMGCRCTRWERTSSARRLLPIWVGPALRAQRERMLGDLASAAVLNVPVVALRRSSPSLVQKLSYLSALRPRSRTRYRRPGATGWRLRRCWRSSARRGWPESAWCAPHNAYTAAGGSWR